MEPQMMTVWPWSSSALLIDCNMYCKGEDGNKQQIGWFDTWFWFDSTNFCLELVNWVPNPSSNKVFPFVVCLIKRLAVNPISVILVHKLNVQCNANERVWFVILEESLIYNLIHKGYRRIFLGPELAVWRWERGLPRCNYTAKRHISLRHKARGGDPDGNPDPRNLDFPTKA